jgi:hypothetical protein
MDAIQQNEIDQIRELGLFLDSELNYAEQYAQILRDVKDSWPGKCVKPFPLLSLSGADCRSVDSSSQR